MSRYRTFNDQDTRPLESGDVAFTGVNAKLAPELLDAGLVHDALNIRFRRGRAETREGSLQVYAAPGDVDFVASGIFSDPFGDEWLLLAGANGTVRQWRHGHTPRTIGTPTATAAGALVQAFGTVLYFRGAAAAPWSWDGQTRTTFAEIDQSESADDTVPIPNGSDMPGLHPVLMGNRVMVPYGRDRIAVSELLDFTRYDALLDDFNVNDGSDDRLTALYPFSNNTLLVFKDQSTYQIANVYGDLSAVRLDQINREVGCAAGRSVASVGGDVFWLGAGGVYRLQQIVQERLQTAPVPVSDPIQPIIQRINGRAISQACAAVAGEYYYLAVPLDGADRNNAILAFNTVTGAWEGVHQFPFALDALHVTDYLGAKALYAIDYAAGRVCVLYVGRSDCFRDFGSRGARFATEAEISTRLETRAYGLGSNGLKLFRRAQVTLETWRPRFSIAIAPTGVSTSTALATARSRSHTGVTVHARAPYVLTNAGDNHALPDREDYAWQLDDNAQLATNGIAPELEQASQERFQFRVTGRSATLTVTSDRGTVAMSSAQLEGEETLRRQRP